MAVLTVQQIDLDGLTPVFVAAASGGDSFVNSGNAYVHIKNGGAGAITVTIDSVQNCNQGFDHNGGGAIAAATDGLFGPFATNRFNSILQQVSITYTGVTSVTIGVFKL